MGEGFNPLNTRAVPSYPAVSEKMIHSGGAKKNNVPITESPMFVCKKTCVASLGKNIETESPNKVVPITDPLARVFGRGVNDVALNIFLGGGARL